MFKRLLRRISKPAKEPSDSRGDAGGTAEIIELGLNEPRTWVGNYPDVPPPESKLTLQMFVARFACGDIYGEDKPAIAADLLEAGYDTPSLRRLAGETQVHCHADAAGIVEQIMREAGFPVPFPLNCARLLVTRQIARKVIAGEREPWSAVRDLNDVWGWRRPETGIQDVDAILRAADEFVWDAEEERFRPVLDADVLEAFARLAKLTDAECAVPADRRS
jgi:hypothetical protein